MSKKTIGSGGSAPYSPGMLVSGALVFVSGQVGSDRVTGETPPDVESQTRNCMERLKAILEQGGTSLAKVVRATVYLTDMGEFQKMNAVYRSFFAGDPPTRTTIGVVALAAPQYKVEIDAVATAE